MHDSWVKFSLKGTFNEKHLDTGYWINPPPPARLVPDMAVSFSLTFRWHAAVPGLKLIQTLNLGRGMAN